MPLYVTKYANGSFSLSEAQLKAVFKEHDANGDGSLCKEDLKAAFHKLGAHFPAWRVSRALHHADANRDGSINVDELDELVKYARNFGYWV